MLSDRQIAKKLEMSYDTLLRWRRDKPLLYNHIKEGFELKEFILDMDSHLSALTRQTQLLRLKEGIDGTKDGVYYVRQVELDEDSKEFFSTKSYLWLEMYNPKVLNILAYERDILLKEDNSSIFIDVKEFYAYGAENGSDWLVSNSMKIEHINEFFSWYSQIMTN